MRSKIHYKWRRQSHLCIIRIKSGRIDCVLSYFHWKKIKRRDSVPERDEKLGTTQWKSYLPRFTSRIRRVTRRNLWIANFIFSLLLFRHYRTNLIFISFLNGIIFYFKKCTTLHWHLRSLLAHVLMLVGIWCARPLLLLICDCYGFRFNYIILWKCSIIMKIAFLCSFSIYQSTLHFHNCLLVLMRLTSKNCYPCCYKIVMVGHKWKSTQEIIYQKKRKRIKRKGIAKYKKCTKKGEQTGNESVASEKRNGKKMKMENLKRNL